MKVRKLYFNQNLLLKYQLKMHLKKCSTQCYMYVYGAVLLRVHSTLDYYIITLLNLTLYQITLASQVMTDASR